jgi:hypothetical protein
MAPPSEPAVAARLGRAPLVSIVLTGRNDDHGKGFRERFFRTLGFNHRELSARGIPHEFVFVEWAPPADRETLAELVREAIPELEPAAVSWFIVDARFQSELSLNPRLQYLEFVAKNVGIRRAKGRFVLASNCDVYFGRHVLDVLQRAALQRFTVYRAARHDLIEGSDVPQPDWGRLEREESLAGPPPTLKPPLLAGATGDFVLLDRDTFQALRGFNEVYRAARIGVDTNFLVKALSSGLRIADIGGPVYHVNHPDSYRLSRHLYDGREAEAPWGNKRWHSRGVVYDNPATWGLSDATSRELRPGCWLLEFSWQAVPPLVDLRRVVLPVARRSGPTPGRYVKR